MPLRLGKINKLNFSNLGLELAQTKRCYLYQNMANYRNICNTYAL